MQTLLPLLWHSTHWFRQDQLLLNAIFASDSEAVLSLTVMNTLSREHTRETTLSIAELVMNTTSNAWMENLQP